MPISVYPDREYGQMQTNAGGTWTNVRGDPTFSAPVVLDPAHHELHEGDHYALIDFIDLSNGATYNLLLVTPNTTSRIHMEWEISVEAEATISAFEGTTTSAQGTPVTAYNNRRDSSNTAALTITHTPTITGDGTRLVRIKAGSGNKVGGGARGDSEWILKSNTQYCLRITNDTANNNWVAFELIWYEHADDA